MCKLDFDSYKINSFTKMLKRIRPSTEPCDIPESIVMKKTSYIVNFHTLLSMLLRNYGETSLCLNLDHIHAV